MSSPEIQRLLNQLVDQPENWENRSEAAEMLSMEGRDGEAIALLDAAPALPYYEPHALKAAEIYSKVDASKAVPVLHGFLQNHPNSALGHLAMAETAAKLGDLRGATQYYERALEINKIYRDPDFEAKYGIVLADAPPAFTAKTATVPWASADEHQPASMKDTTSLPTAADPVEPEPAAVEPSQSTQSPPEDVMDRPRRSSRGRNKRRSPAKKGNWMITALVATGVFCLSWLLLLLTLQSMLSSR